MKTFLQHKRLFVVSIMLGLILRVVFTLWGGKIYYGKPDYYIQGDTYSWFYSFINLVETGTFTADPSVENGKFFRPPGYSFLYGICYLVTGNDFMTAAYLLVCLQVVMDVINIFLLGSFAFSVARMQAPGYRYAIRNLAALLYAVYPFVIVWSPVLYAETSSIFFLLLGFYLASRKLSAATVFLSAAFIGIASLIRLQCVFAIPFVVVLLLFRNKFSFREFVKHSLLFGFGIVVTFGLWPARNYFFQGRLLFSQDLNIGKHWSPDYMAFMDYIYSVRTDHVPVYREIVNNKPVQWPDASYAIAGDSALLDSVVALCRTCGTGFSYFMYTDGIKDKVIDSSANCDARIALIYDRLTNNQRTKNQFSYWIKVPLNNLKKCFFKWNIYGDKSGFVKAVTAMLFGFRSLLLILGIAGLYLAVKNRALEGAAVVAIAGYMVTWYLYLSFFYRNMEMRYLIHADVLLLIPAACLLVKLIYRNENANYSNVG